MIISQFDIFTEQSKKQENPKLGSAWQEARLVMEELNIGELPVDPFLVAKRLGILVDSYSLCEKEQPERIKLLRKAKCEAIASKDTETDEYHILYDSDNIAMDRIRFTIAHEIGHVWMGHVEKYGHECFRNGGFKSANHPAEKEADNFAGELLRPPVLMALLDKKEVYDIQSICNVSFRSASIGSRQTKQIAKYMYKSCKDEISFYSNRFHDFIHQKFCPVCKCHSVVPNAQYCHICGNGSILWGNSLSPVYDFIGEVKHVLYPKYQLDQTGKAIICPRCNNEEIYSGYSHCKICGTNLVNSCAGEEDADWNGNMYYKKEPCGTIPDGNARYCIKCGCETTFYQQKLLGPWEDEKNRIETVQPVNAIFPPPPPGLIAPQKDWKAGNF